MHRDLGKSLAVLTLISPMLRPVTFAVLLVATSLAPACGVPASRPASDAHATPAPRRDAPSGVLPDERQILWQRDLEQALALARAEDRPLFIALDVGWEYADPADMLAPDHARYVAAEQVRDVVAAVFHEFVSESIQHLVHEMGQRLLERFPHLAMVSFEAQNRTKDPVAVSEADPRVKVYSEPFPAYGLIKLRMRRRA